MQKLLLPEDNTPHNKDNILKKASSLSPIEFASTINNYINKASSDALYNTKILPDIIKTPNNLLIQKDAEIRREYMRACNDAIINKCDY
jgi:hypothetical protein